MTSMYQISVPPLVRVLTNLSGILAKGAAHAEAKGIDPTVLINSRLYPDMFPLSKQVQIASDVARRGIARLASMEAPPMKDNEVTFDDLIARSSRTIDYLKTFSPEQINGTEEKTILLPMGKDTLTFEGLPYLNGFIMPNVYFHVTTPYNILRHCGVEVGKLDFLGKP
jgi:uncharacterized protein